MRYFDGLATPEAIKKEFRRLAFIHHPDRGGDTATMQEIIAQYHAALANVNGYQSTGTDGKEHVYTYRRETEQTIVDKINEILGLRLDGINVWLVGLWIWIDGDTRPHRRDLKGAGSWHSKRKKWHWKPYNGRSRHSSASFEGLCSKYGVQEMQQEEETDMQTTAA